MLCIAFIMAGWSFHSVENPYFIKFMGNVRPNFELPSDGCANGCANVDDPDYLVNVESLNGDIDFDHAALTSANAAAAVPANTRAMLGDNTEDFSLADMISVD
ncbi:TPA: hypothetical protein ACH3X1_009012 [Trebouxia sp. C0004]